MEAIKLRYDALQKALMTLQEALEAIEQLSRSDQSIMYKLIRDGVIQRFEYCIDAFWKFSKLYLEFQFKISVESSSPKTILKIALDMQMISDDECIILLDSVSDRNLTSHSYNEA